MSLGLAIQKISEYTGALQTISEEVDKTEYDVMKAANEKSGDAFKEAHIRLTRLKTLMGLIKDFIEFWKDVLKTFLGLLKGMNELIRGGQ